MATTLQLKLYLYSKSTYLSSIFFIPTSDKYSGREMVSVFVTIFLYTYLNITYIIFIKMKHLQI